MARVDLIIKAIDQASNTIGSIDRRLQGLQNTTKNFTADTILGGLAIGAGFAAVNTAINLATSALNSFGKALSNAAEIQVETTVLAGQLSQLLNKSYEETTSILDELNKTITEQVDVLPGLTEGYTRLGRQLLDSVIPAATELDGSLNTKKLIEYTTELSRAYGLLAQTTPGLTQDEVLSTLTKAIGGTATLAELFRLDLFQKNPILQRALREELVRRGVDELKDLDEAARVEVLRKVGSLILTDETISRLSNTLQGRLEGLFTKLFDPTSGIFGFARQLDTRGNFTVLDAVNNAVGQFFEVLNEIASIFSDLGFRDTGILESLYDFFTWLAEQLQTVEILIKNNRDRILRSLDFVRKFMSGEQSFVEFLFNLGQTIGRVLGNLIGNLAKNSEQINEFARNLIVAISSFLTGILVGIGRGLADSLIGDPEELAEKIKTGMFDLMSNYVQNMLYVAIPGSGLFSQSETDARSLGEKILDGILYLFNELINSYFNGLFPFLGEVYPDIQITGQQLAQVVQSMIADIRDLILDFVEGAYSAIKNIIPLGNTVLPEIDLGTPNTANIDASKQNIKNSAYGAVSSLNAISVESSSSLASKSNLLSNRYSNSNSNSVPNVTINVQGILDERIIRQIKSAIQSEWKQYKNTYAAY